MSYEFILPLDKHATSTTNYILGEEHDVNSDEETVFVLERGAFYTKDLAIVNLTTGLPMTVGVDYNPVHHFTTATNKFGNEVMCAISIINPDMRGRFAVNVRYVGGSYQNLVDPLRELIATLEADGRPVEYGQIIGLPDQFIPAEHLHSVYDTYGYEYQVEAQMAIHDALVNGSQAAVYEVLTMFDNVVTQYESDIAQLEAMLTSHVGATGNVHLLTRQQLSVDKVPNTGWATLPQALAYTPGYFMDPSLTKAVGDQLILQSMTAHLAAPNPHGTTKTTIGLSLVENFGMATLATYNAQSPRGYIDNLVLKQVIDQAGGSYASQSQFNTLQSQFNAHISANNPHGITAALLGLGNVNNYATATPAQTAAGTATNLHTTPAGVAAAIAALAPVKSVQGRTGNVTLNSGDRPSLGLGENDSPRFSTVEARTGTTFTRIDAEGIFSKKDPWPVNFMPLPLKDENQIIGTVMGSGYTLLPYSHVYPRNIPGSGANLTTEIEFSQEFCSIEVISFGAGSGSVTFIVGTNKLLDVVWLFDRTSNVDGSGSVEIPLYNAFQTVKLLYIRPTARPIFWGNEFKMPEEGPPDLNNGLINLVALHYNNQMPAGQQYMLQYLGGFQP